MNVEIRIPTDREIDGLWEYNVSSHPDDARWVRWAREYRDYYKNGWAQPFAVIIDGVPVGEVSILLDGRVKAAQNDVRLVEMPTRANLNALRIRKEYEGKGYVSRMVKFAENWCVQRGITTMTIGVDECEERNRAIYAHWKYTQFLFDEYDEDGRVLFYAKNLLEQKG